MSREPARDLMQGENINLPGRTSGPDDWPLRDIQLRITTSLQAIVALLDVQAARSGNQAVRAALETAVRRITAIGRVHAVMQHLDQTQGDMIDLDAYLTGLLDETGLALDRNDPRRTVHVAFEPLPVAPTVAQQLGLILTELMDNAVRHGTSQGGRIWVTGARLPGGGYRLCVEDDGLGLPVGFDPRDRHGGLGLQIVTLTADQVGARLTADGKGGARFTLTLLGSAEI